MNMDQNFWKPWNQNTDQIFWSTSNQNMDQIFLKHLSQNTDQNFWKRWKKNTEQNLNMPTAQALTILTIMALEFLLEDLCQKRTGQED